MLNFEGKTYNTLCVWWTCTDNNILLFPQVQGK